MRKLLGTLVLLLAASGAGADERILSYDSRIEVRSDSSLEVTERIRVRAEGSKIRRGIFREFPTTYSRPDGTKVTVGFEVMSVRRNGMDEPYHTERRSNGVAVYVGRKDYLLPPAHTATRSAIAPTGSSASSPITTSCTGTSPAWTGTFRSIPSRRRCAARRNSARRGATGGLHRPDGGDEEALPGAVAGRPPGVRDHQAARAAARD